MIATTAMAEEVGISADTISVTVQTANGAVEIMRNQDPEARLGEPWVQTSRPCPSFASSR
jgi:hypothetical protein